MRTRRIACGVVLLACIEPIKNRARFVVLRLALDVDPVNMM